MRRNEVLQGLALSLVVGVQIMATSARAEDADPTSLRDAIEARYPGVPWISTAELARLMSSSTPSELILLDVREPDEFEVSHLHGARRVAPDLTDVASLGIPRGATVVVYCSVGYRSAAMGQRLRAAGVPRVRNLAGGIFQWANEGRPLYDSAGRADRVHPYDATWGRFLRERYRHEL